MQEDFEAKVRKLSSELAETFHVALEAVFKTAFKAGQTKAKKDAQAYLIARGGKHGSKRFRRARH